MGSKRYFAFTLASFAMLLVLLQGAAPRSVRAQSVAQATATPTLPRNEDFSVDDLKVYQNRSVAELCSNPTRTVRDEEYLTFQNPSLCNGYHGARGFLSAGVYGYGHPNTTYCNATNGLKVGIPGLAFGPSIGNKNLLQWALLALGLVSAGCNNAPVAQVTPAPTPLTTATPVAIIGPDTLNFDHVKQASQNFGISEVGYGGQFVATASDGSLIKVAPFNAKPSAAGAPVTFSATTQGSGGSATIRVIDEAGHERAILVSVTTPTPATPTPTPTITPSPAAT